MKKSKRTILCLGIAAVISVMISSPVAQAKVIYNEGSIVEVKPEDMDTEAGGETAEGAVSAGKTYEGELTLTDVKLDGNIIQNVYIAGINVGGMDKAQAMSACQPAVDSYATATIRFILGEQIKEVTASELGYVTDLDRVVDEALTYGKKGNCLKRFKDTAELTQGLRMEQLNLSPGFDEAGRANVENILQEFNREQKPASISMNEDSTFTITPEQTGIQVRVDDSIAALRESMRGEWSGVLDVNVAYDETVPDANSAALSQLTDELGSYTTNYSGDAGRMRNVENATNFINGTLLMPGEELDVNATIEPYTEENGYYYAGEYSGGKVVQGLGGGICQVSTTLYNAVLYAELEVVQRQNHSLTVGYVDLSRDAAIAGSVKNFRFKNNMETPIYIAGGCSNGNITFAIYGKETRPANRTIELESRLIETIAPPAEPVEEEDASLEPGERKVTQKARNGYVAELWKNIYIDGVLSESVQINTSKYNATPEYASVGPGEAPEEAEGEGEQSPAEGEQPPVEGNDAPAEGEAPAEPQV